MEEFLVFCCWIFLSPLDIMAVFFMNCKLMKDNNDLPVMEQDCYSFLGEGKDKLSFK